MSKYFNKIKIILLISIISLSTACNNLNGFEDLDSSNTEVTTIETSKEVITTTTTSEQDLLIEFNDYTYQKNDDGTFNFTITQEAMEGCYYTISLMYDDTITEFVSGDGYLRSEYGKFAGETSEETSSNEDEEDNNDEDENEDITTTLDDKYTLSEDKIKSLIGKDGNWTFKCVSEGTQYIEIKLINEYGDIRYKSQYTCIVDTHLEPHLYYTNINY